MPKHLPLAPGELMKRIESDSGFDPMPVEHHEFPMKYPELIDSAVTEFMSLIYSKTIRKGHRSPVAVDGAGKYFLIEHVAEDRGWTLDWAQRVLKRAIDRGLVRHGRGGRHDFPPASIVICGRVKPFKTEVDASPNDLVGTECTLRKLRRLLSESEYLQFEKLSGEEQSRFADFVAAEAEVDERIKADAIWLARQAIQQRHNTRLLQFGIEPDAASPKRRKDEPIVELRLNLAQEEPATIAAAAGANGVRSVHSAAANGRYTPSERSVQSAASLFTSPEGFSPELLVEDRGRQAGFVAVVEEPPACLPPEPNPKQAEPETVDDLEIALVNRGYPQANFMKIRQTLNDVPNEFYFQILDERLARARESHERIGTGLLIHIARDAVKAHGKVKATRAAGY